MHRSERPSNRFTILDTIVVNDDAERSYMPYVWSDQKFKKSTISLSSKL